MDEQDQELPDFSVSLVLTDAIPVLFFFFTTLFIAKRLKKAHKVAGTLFYIASVLPLTGSTLQVLWKLFIAVERRNIPILHSQFKYTMGLGFLLIFFSIIIARKQIKWNSVIKKIFKFPSGVFIFISTLCSLAMIVFIFTLDRNEVYVNWIEEGVNIIFQGSVFLCTLFATKMENQVSNTETVVIEKEKYIV